MIPLSKTAGIEDGVEVMVDRGVAGPADKTGRQNRPSGPLLLPHHFHLGALFTVGNKVDACFLATSVGKVKGRRS